MPRTRTNIQPGGRINLTDEAKNAINRTGPSDEVFINMLISNAESSLPTSSQVRWMAAFILKQNGYKLIAKDGTELWQ